MTRPLRIEFPGALYHVTARGNERKPIYRDAEDRQRFLQRLAGVVEIHKLAVYAYVLMRNHYHLLVETRMANLSRAMRQLNGVYTQDFNRRHHRAGHLFQGRYKAILVDKNAYLLELSRYIHLNPVRVGEVKEAWEFSWSSAAAFVGKAPAPEYLLMDEVLAHFGRRRATARRRYGGFLRDGLDQRGEPPWAAVEGQVLLGERRWVERQKQRLRHRLRAGEEVTGARQLRVQPPVSVVITQVCRGAKIDPPALLRRGRRRESWARGMAMALAWEVCGLSQREIGRIFGVGPYAVAKTRARLAQRMAADRKLRRQLDRLKSNVQT